MTDRPILFSAPMVRALLAGRKTQTRRMFNGIEQMENGSFHIFGGMVGVSEEDVPKHAPDYVRIQVGDHLWVREAWRCNGWATDVATIFYAASAGDGYTAMCEQYPVADKRPLRVTGGWRPSIHMPRWASRLTLTVTDVRVERLKDISGSDAIAEGADITSEQTMTGPMVKVAPGTYLSPVAWYHRLWDSINGAGAWDANPWVVAYTFTVQHGNIDQIARAAA